MPRSAWPTITVCMLRVGKGNIMKSVIAIIKKSMLTKNINDIPRNFPIQIIIALTMLSSAYTVILAAARGSSEAYDVMSTDIEI